MSRVRMGFMLVLLNSACSSREDTPLRLEVCRETIQGRQEVVYLLVDPARLSEAGISEEEPKRLVKSYFDEIGQFIGEMAAHALGGPAPSEKETHAPAWVPRVFPSGIPVEVVVTEKDGSQKTAAGVIRPSRFR